MDYYALVLVMQYDLTCCLVQLLGAVVSGLVGLFVVRNAEVVGNTAAGDSL